MSPIVAAFLRSTVLPAVLAAIGIVFAGGVKDPLRSRLQAIIIALAYALGSYLLLGRLDFPPGDMSEALTYLALALAAFVCVAPKEDGLRYTLRAIVVLAGGAFLLWPIHASLTGYVHARNLIAFFCLALGMWSVVEAAVHKVCLASLILLPLISATTVSLLLLFSASASLSQLVTVVCGQLGAALAVSLVSPGRISTYALLPFLSVLVGFFMATGHFYLDMNPWHLVFASFPYFLLWFRAFLPVPTKPIVEAPMLAALAGAPMAYFVWTVFQKAGPLY